jgi:uncharacterized DUF497 family protein
VAALEFEWDEKKSDACYRERGFDFAFAIRVFRNPDRVDVIDDRYDYGEERLITYGRIDGFFYAVVYTLRIRAPDHFGPESARARGEEDRSWR